MNDMNEMFRKECEELEIDYREFPFDFPINSSVNYISLFQAIMWIMKKRQDKIMEEAGIFTKTGA